MILTVHHLIKGNLETDVRRGRNFRWHLADGMLNVFQHDAEHQIVWTKSYLFPVSAEMSAGETP